MKNNKLSEESQKHRAEDLLNQGRLEEARDLLSGLCGPEQHDPGIWSLLCTANGYLGRYEDVVSASTRALEIDPDNLIALNHLASALAALGHLERASVEFEKLLQLTPDQPAVLVNYAHNLHLLGRMDEARVALEDAVRIQPHYAEAHYNLAILLQQSGHLKESLQEYEQAATLNPGLPGIEKRIWQLKSLS